MCRSITSLSKITHQMWHNHLFSQRNKATKKASSGSRSFGECGQNLKIGVGGGGGGNIGGSS